MSQDKHNTVFDDVDLFCKDNIKAVDKLMRDSWNKAPIAEVNYKLDENGRVKKIYRVNDTIYSEVESYALDDFIRTRDENMKNLPYYYQHTENSSNQIHHDSSHSDSESIDSDSTTEPFNDGSEPKDLDSIPPLSDDDKYIKLDNDEEITTNMDEID